MQFTVIRGILFKANYLATEGGLGMRLLVLDGNSILNRAFYGVKLLTTKDGHYTNALVGFLNIFLKLRDQTAPDRIAVAFDRKAPTFRHQRYAAYKAGRKGMPDELAEQLPVIKELLGLMGCTVVEQDGYEADDILGTLSAAVVRQGGDCFIATGDRDALQLVEEKVTVLLAATKMGRPDTTAYDIPAIREKYGLLPDQLIDLKALMGDASDNIPGVPGIGEKTALSLLYAFHTLDELYAHLDSPEIREGVRNKLIAGKDSAYLSRELGTICRQAPVETDMDAYTLKPVKREELARRMAQLELFKLAERMGVNDPLSTSGIASDNQESPAPSLTRLPISDLLARVRESRRLDFLPVVEEGALAGFWCMAGANSGCAAAYIGREDAAYPELLALLRNDTVEKRTHDVKALSSLLLRENPEESPGLEQVSMDTMLAGYLLNPLASGYELPRLAQEYEVSQPVGEGVPTEVGMLSPLSDRLERELKEREMEDLLRGMEIPLAGVLADMESIGFEVDVKGIAEFGALLEDRITAIQRQITEEVGYAFNLNSPKQLAVALFEDLGLPAQKKTKTGYSTSAEVLESLRNAHPVVDMLLDYRTLSKLKSTYCDGLLKVVGPDGRIHSSFNQTETRTGRISSAEPNLQNIPVRQELGRELRRFFRAREGWVLCDADYSQIELRVLAHMAGDPTMIEAFNTGADIHRITASQVFGVPEDLVTPLMRSRAKAVNFGIVYGIGAHSLSQDIHVSYAEAKTYIEEYLCHYGAVAGFMSRLIEEAKSCGYAKTLYGRRRPLPELRASNRATRSFGERVARNMPIQGTAADIIKRAMVRVHRRLAEEGMRARLILQVHDELIVEAPEEEAERAAALLKEEMEGAADLSVKLSVDVHVGKTWYDAKG